MPTNELEQLSPAAAEADTEPSIAADPRLDQLADQPAKPRFLWDMVHYNPGEPAFDTPYADARVLADLGYNGRVFWLFESAQLAVDWSGVDPAIFPPGSEGRRWVDAKAAELRAQYRAAKEAGLTVLCQCDLILFPRQLVKSRGLDRFDDPRDSRTRDYVEILLREMFRAFPDLDGIVVRLGETYLHDAPHHVGGIRQKDNADETIIPLLELLRRVVCEDLDKKVVMRTWLSFDRPTSEKYLHISRRIEPHRNLLFSDKHCEDDFHRGNRFSRYLGIGRHPQIVEVQCQREYEGKGAYPNYVMNGVIEGFEEYAHVMNEGQMRSLREFVRHPLYAGVWTWSRGGGWEGPYLKNTLWVDLNVRVLARWLQNPGQSEEEAFNGYVREHLKLDGGDLLRFRELCLLSAAAVVRGKRSTHADIDGWWSRDHYIGSPPLPRDPDALRRVLAEKHEAVSLWQRIVGLAGSIRFADSGTEEFVRTSCRYGLILYTIYRVAFDLAATQPGTRSTATDRLVAEYDALQAAWRELQARSKSCATLYRDVGFRESPQCGGVGQVVNAFRR